MPVRALTKEQNRQLFQNILARAKAELVPKLYVAPKSTFVIHEWINSLLNRTYSKKQQNMYLEDYTTTLGYTVAIADYHGTDVAKFGNWRTLCHEIVHAVDAQKWTRFLFGFLYLYPISFGILLILTGWTPLFWAEGWRLAIAIGGWAVIAGLHFIPQLPDPWRSYWEFKAYSVSMHLYYLVHDEIPTDYIDRLVKNFHSMAYYIMEPNQKRIKRKLNRLAMRIRKGKSPVGDLPIVKIAEEEYHKIAMIKDAA